MKYSSFCIALILLLASVGCEKNVQSFAIDVVLAGPPPEDEKSNVYPQDLKMLAQPIENAGVPKMNIALYPLTLKRVDIGKSQAMDYESNHATNFKKIKAVERGWKTFFDSSTPPAWLFSPQKPNYDLKEYISQNKSSGNIFFFSEEKQAVSDVQTFNNIQDLRTALAEFASSPDRKTSKAIIIYKPATGVPSVVAESPADKKRDSVPISIEPTVAATHTTKLVPTGQTATPTRTATPAGHLVASPDLQQKMQQLTGSSLNGEEKEVLKQGILKKFEPDAKVYLFKGGQVTSIKAIQSYLESLIVTQRNISRIITIDSVKKFEDAKIYDIYIHETAAEIQ